MRYWSLVPSLLFSSFLSLLPASTLEAAADEIPQNLRPVDAAAAETLARALDGSPLVRALVHDLGATNVIVHIQFSRDLPSGIAGTTRFVVSCGGYRYLRITIGVSLPEVDRAPILAHELQHAWEIAHSHADEIDDVRQMLELAGYQTRENFFETGKAVKVERMVREELRDWKLTARSATPSRSALPGK